MVRELLRKVDSLASVSKPSNRQGTLPHDDFEDLRLGHVREGSRILNETAALRAARSDQSEESTSFLHGSSIPILSLVDNTVLEGRQVGAPCRSKEYQSHTTKETSNATLELLRSQIPKIQPFLTIVEASGCAWDLFEGAFPTPPASSRSQVGDSKYTILEAWASQILATNNVAVLVKICFGLAICLQQLPQSFDFVSLALPSTLEIQQNRYLSAAESVLSADQNLAASQDGLECMLIQTMYYVNMGKARTAWLTTQRAISVCNMLTIYGRRDTSISTESIRWQNIWKKFWNRDKQLSLLLGLPYTPSVRKHEFIDMHGKIMDQQGLATFWMNIGHLTSQVIDRNQTHSGDDFASTLHIEHQMESMERSVPLSWWELPVDPHMSHHAIEHAYLSQFLFHNIRKHLHMPFMLKALADDKRYEYNRWAALEASRKMIKIYKVLRDKSRPILSICNTEDFQVLTAALVLVVNLLSPQAVGVHCIAADWELIQNIKGIFARISQERGCSVASQGEGLLEAALKARYSLSQTDTCSFEAIVPYFGRISLSRKLQPPQMNTTEQTDFANDEERGIYMQANDLPFVTQANLIQPWQGEFFDWTAVDAGWPHLEDDLHVDWSLFGQQ